VLPAVAFAYGTPEQRQVWRALIATLEDLLRLHQHRAGALVALDEYLYQRTAGMIGSLSQLVRGAAVLAIADGTEAITRELLDVVPVDHAAAQADIASRRGKPRRRAAAG
jgi:hypothetical protein